MAPMTDAELEAMGMENRTGTRKGSTIVVRGGLKPAEDVEPKHPSKPDGSAVRPDTGAVGAETDA